MAQLSLFVENQTISHDGRPLTILKRLSSGLTGEVYKARLDTADGSVDVAVKAMKSLDFPLARELFLQEGGTLAALMRLEEEVKEPLAEGKLKIAPLYYGLSEFKAQTAGADEGIPYLVMEFISGAQLPDLLKQQPRLVEIQALTIAWQLYRVLDILHIRLQKTFIDLKFENLWWVNNPESKWGGQLKLTDFGTLEDIRPGDEKRRGVARDLLLGGVYLLNLLSGEMLDYSLGELRERAEPVIDRHKEEFTWGARRLLKRLLHRNPQARPQSAAEVLKELRTLLNFWGQTPERLQEMAQNNLTAAEKAAEQAHSAQREMSVEGLEAARRAYAALHILRSKAPNRAQENDFRRAETVLAIGDYLERGLALLQGRSFVQARQVFEQGINWDENPALLRRWSYVARMGEEIPPADLEARFTELQALLRQMDERHYDSAARELEALRQPSLNQPGLASRGLEALISEARLFEALDRAQNFSAESKYIEASQAYGEAQQLFQQLPTEFAALAQEETGLITLSRLNEDAKKDLQQAQQALAQLQTALQNRDLAASRQALQDLTPWLRALSDRLPSLLALARSALAAAAAAPEQASAFLALAADLLTRLTPQESAAPEAQNLGYLVSALQQALTAARAANPPLLEQHSRQAAALLPEDSRPWAAAALLPAARLAQSAENPVMLQTCARLWAEIFPAQAAQAEEWKTQAETWSQAATQRQREQVDSLLAQAQAILMPILPLQGSALALKDLFAEAARQAENANSLEIVSLQNAASRLERAGRLLVRAKPLAERDSYRLEEIHTFSQALTEAWNKAQQAETAQTQANRKLRRDRLTALSQERAELEKEWNWAAQAADPKLRETAFSSLRERLSQFLYRCYQVAADDHEGLQAALARLEVMQRTGEPPADPQDDPAVLEIHLRWAQRALDSLGAQAWQDLAQMAGKRAEEIRGEFHEAQNAFARGDLGLLAAELDRSRAEHAQDPAWQSLKRQMAQARAWQAWVEARQGIFAAGEADPAFLQDLRAAADLKLPPVYLEQSPLQAYLTLARKNLREQAAQYFQAKKSAHAAEFLELLNRWLQVEATMQVFSAQKPPRQEPKAWLAALYEAARSRKLAEVEKLTASLPLPAGEIPSVFVTLEEWEALRRERERAQQNQQNLRRLGFVAAGFAALCVLLFAGTGIFYLARPDDARQMLQGTYTPTPTLTFTPTLTPSPTLTPTLTPTPSLTPTPIPNSGFLFSVAALYPPLPAEAQEIWLINNPQAILEPPLAAQGQTTWQAATSEDAKAKGEKFAYTKTGKASVTWQMDVPFREAGLYGVYIVDTKTLSAGTQTFTISLDGQPVQPYRGVNTVTFRSAAQGQKSDQWLALGMYQAQPGQRLSVAVQLGELTEQTPFAADRVLIVRLAPNAVTMLEALPQERRLVSLLDEAAFFEVVGDKPAPVKNQGSVFMDALSWGASLLSRNEPAGYVTPIWVDWTPLGLLPAGNYEVRVWIPEKHATINGEYQLLLDGKVLPRESPAQVNQADHANEWWTLGVWQIPQPGAVSLRLVVPPNIAGEIGVDAVVILSIAQ